jgi:anti-anti-sigma factor
MTIATVSARVEGTSVSVSVSGEIDIDNAASVEERILASITNLATRVLVDLTNVEYMDSSGLRILFTLAARLNILQIELDVVTSVSSPARRALELAGFDALRDLSAPASQPPSISQRPDQGRRASP